MACTRPVLVVSSPGGPVQDVPGVPAGCGEYQQPEQAQEFVAGERGHPGLVAPPCPAWVCSRAVAMARKA